MSGITEILSSFFSMIGQLVGSITRSEIGSKKDSTISPAYLVLGASPSENRNGRTFYDDEHYWLLDVESAGSNVDTSRFFNINFTDAQQMSYLALQLQKEFDAIVFDVSTMKFFNTNSASNINRLIDLKVMLKEGGLLYMEVPGPPGGGREFGNTTDYKAKFLEDTKQAGLELVNESPMEELAETEVIRDIFLSGQMPTVIRQMQLKPEPYIILTFKVATKGGKRKRNRKTRKASRKHP